ncbi:MAG: SEC-C domain-containing protein [Ardenticatenales bacterium]|nr:SEC-C domain-containing protein [Ardenticatenales bacterium]
MFADMRNNIDTGVAERFFREISAHQEFIRQQQAAAAAKMQLNQSGYEVVQRGKGRGVELRREMPKVGRNDPCPCGSGKKYKNCHMRQDMAASAGTSAGSNGQQNQSATAGQRKAKRRRR